MPAACSRGAPRTASFVIRAIRVVDHGPLAITKHGKAGLRALLSFHIIQSSKAQLNATIRGVRNLSIYKVTTTLYMQRNASRKQQIIKPPHDNNSEIYLFPQQAFVIEAYELIVFLLRISEAPTLSLPL